MSTTNDFDLCVMQAAPLRNISLTYAERERGGSVCVFSITFAEMFCANYITNLFQY